MRAATQSFVATLVILVVPLLASGLESMLP